eukprot:1485860-Prymnesium_polylepis.1
MHADPRVTGTHTMRRSGAWSHTRCDQSHVTGHAAGRKRRELSRSCDRGGTRNIRGMCAKDIARRRESRSVQMHALSKVLRVRLWRSLLLRPRRSQ